MKHYRAARPGLASTYRALARRLALPVLGGTVGWLCLYVGWSFARELAR